MTDLVKPSSKVVKKIKEKVIEKCKGKGRSTIMGKRSYNLLEPYPALAGGGHSNTSTKM